MKTFKRFIEILAVYDDHVAVNTTDLIKDDGFCGVLVRGGNAKKKTTPQYKERT